ncbi:unnamed protein product, partial [Staurois parvus]
GGGGGQSAVSWSRDCLRLGGWRRNSAPLLYQSGRGGGYSTLSLVSVGGIVPHRWFHWVEKCPTLGVSGGNSAPSLLSVEGIVPHHWVPCKE